MSSDIKSLSIVIPAFNEEFRLPDTIAGLKAFLKSSTALNLAENIELIVIDDGSTDCTSNISQKLLQGFKRTQFYQFDKNYGKGAAVRKGLELARSPYVLFADADMSTPWSEFFKLSRLMENGEYDIVIASRALPLSEVKVRQSFVRQNMGRIFNLIVRLITKLPFHDTQCGFKLIKMSSIRKILPHLKINRFAWDVEFLMYAQCENLKIIDIPVEWNHKEASRVRPIVDSLEMLFSILKIKFCYRYKSSQNSF